MAAIRSLALILGTAVLTYLATAKYQAERDADQSLGANAMTFGAVDDLRGATGLQATQLAETKAAVAQIASDVSALNKQFNAIGREIQAAQSKAAGDLAKQIQAVDQTSKTAVESVAQLRTDTELHRAKDLADKAEAHAAELLKAAAAVPTPATPPLTEVDPPPRGPAPTLFGPDRVVFFWAPWCVHCKPLLTVQARARFKAAGLELGATDKFKIQTAEAGTAEGERLAKLYGFSSPYDLPSFVRIDGGTPVEIMKGAVSVDELVWFARHDTTKPGLRVSAGKVATFRQVSPP